MRCIVLLLLAASVSFAQCGGSVSHYLPAVVDSDGIFVNVTLALENGSGDIYVSIYPKVGISTQESITDAVSYAFKFGGSGRNGCDAIIKAYLPEGKGGYLDGPSGGAAIALMTIAALEGREIRNDATVTGTISNSGRIGEVGGLYEKVKIAKDSGLKYFLTPRQNLYERIILRLLQQNDGITVFEVRNVSEAKAFLVDGKNISGEKTAPYVEQINETLPAYEGRQEFRALAEEMIALLTDSTRRISQELMQEEMLGQYFGQIGKNGQTLFEKGYYFSAANDAFINYLDAETIANSGNLDFMERVAKTEECLSQTPMLGISGSNLDWAAGQEVRAGWVRKKISELAEQNITLEEEKYLAYREAMYAYSWCKIIGMLGKNAPSGGAAADESALRNLSEGYLAKALETGSEDDDILWHLQNAEELHSKGMYAGAIIDSVFVIENSEAERILNGDNEKANEELAQLSTEKRKSLWADVYASHGAYVLWKGDNATAYPLFRFAKGLDEANLRMLAEIDRAGGAQAKQDDGGLGVCLYIPGFALMITGVAITYFHLSAQQRISAQQKPRIYKKGKRQ